jgi:hypothetical protein
MLKVRLRRNLRGSLTSSTTSKGISLKSKKRGSDSKRSFRLTGRENRNGSGCKSVKARQSQG